MALYDAPMNAWPLGRLGDGVFGKLSPDTGQWSVVSTPTFGGRSKAIRGILKKGTSRSDIRPSGNWNPIGVQFKNNNTYYFGWVLRGMSGRENVMELHERRP